MRHGDRFLVSLPAAQIQWDIMTDRASEDDVERFLSEQLRYAEGL